jgi:uncharacterized membrane protein
VLLAVVSAEKHVASWRQRWLLLLTGGMMTLAFTLLMYALWNPVGAPFIHNLGGKYFIPIVPVVALAFSNDILHRWRKPVETGALTILAISHVVILIQVILRYYCSAA